MAQTDHALEPLFPSRDSRTRPYSEIPVGVIKHAKGLAILTQDGSGVLTARTRTGWSGPCAIATGAVEAAAPDDALTIEFHLVLNSGEAVATFASGRPVTIGKDLSAAPGPLERASVVVAQPERPAIYAYVRVDGVFSPATLDGAVITPLDGTNARYYGRSITPGTILSGAVAPPSGALQLQRVLADLGR